MAQEKLGNLEASIEYYEKAAKYAEKLGQFSESMIYFKKFESLSKILYAKYQSGEENPIVTKLKYSPTLSTISPSLWPLPDFSSWQV